MAGEATGASRAEDFGLVRHRDGGGEGELLGCGEAVGVICPEIGIPKVAESSFCSTARVHDVSASPFIAVLRHQDLTKLVAGGRAHDLRQASVTMEASAIKRDPS